MVGEIKKTYLAFLLFAAVLVLMPAKAFPLTASDITQGMTCTCGCSMVLGACAGSMECGPAAQITQEVIQMIEMGQTKEEILRHYVDKYGETILAAPTKEGFNFLAWVLPFLGLAAGIGGIYIFLDRALTSKLVDDEEIESSEPYSEEDKKHLEQFQSELDAYEI